MISDINTLFGPWMHFDNPTKNCGVGASLKKHGLLERFKAKKALVGAGSDVLLSENMIARPAGTPGRSSASLVVPCGSPPSLEMAIFIEDQAFSLPNVDGGGSNNFSMRED